MRKALEEKNPQIKLLTELRYRDAPADYLPSDSQWWLRNAQGDAVDGWKGKDRDNYKKLDFTNTKLQDQIAAQAKAAIRSGAVDGVMLDWFNEISSIRKSSRSVAEKNQRGDRTRQINHDQYELYRDARERDEAGERLLHGVQQQHHAIRLETNRKNIRLR